MNEFIKKIGLLGNLRMELPIDRTDFVKTLKGNVDPAQSDFFDVFSSSKNVYKGGVTNESFAIRRRRRLFDMNMNWAKSTGKISQTNDKLILDIEINSFHFMIIPFVFVAVLIYSIAIVSILTVDMGGTEASWALPFLFIHAAFMFGIPYFILRRSLRLARYDIERDIYFMMKDKLRTPARTGFL